MTKPHEHSPGYTNTPQTIIRCRRCRIEIRPVICQRCYGDAKIFTKANGWTKCPECTNGISSYEPIDDQPMIEKWDSLP